MIPTDLGDSIIKVIFGIIYSSNQFYIGRVMPKTELMTSLRVTILANV